MRSFNDYATSCRQALVLRRGGCTPVRNCMVRLQLNMYSIFSPLLSEQFFISIWIIIHFSTKHFICSLFYSYNHRFFFAIHISIHMNSFSFYISHIIVLSSASYASVYNLCMLPIVAHTHNFSTFYYYLLKPTPHSFQIQTN